jgi:phage terminase large subunit GpA-like protein
MSRSVAAYLRGQQDPKKNYAFVTQHKCQAWKDVVEPKKESEILTAHRCKMPEGIVPPEAVALTMGIDMQKVGFWFVVRAWGRELTSWLIRYGYLSTWEDVETMAFGTRYPVDGTDRTMGIFRAGLDTGGGKSSDDEWSRTEEAYQWLRKHSRGVVFGIKGASRPQLQRVKVTTIDRMARGNRPIPGGLDLRIIDVGQFKDLIHWRMTRKQGESQRWFLHAGTGHDYVRQLLAEEKRKDRHGKATWVQIRRDNHLLDCEVIAAACADSEWSPSLQFLANRDEAAKKAAEKAKKQKPPAQQPAVRGPRQLPDWFSRR